MSFQHTLYLKKDAETVAGLPDEYDGTLYHWCCGARDFASSVRANGSVFSECPDQVIFTPVQVAKLLASLNRELHAHYQILMRGYDDFTGNVLLDENMKADEKALQSYAIMRQMKKELEAESFYYLTQFGDLNKMKIIVKALTSLIDRMRDDDILVWDLSY